MADQAPVASSEFVLAIDAQCWWLYKLFASAYHPYSSFAGTLIVAWSIFNGYGESISQNEWAESLLNWLNRSWMQILTEPAQGWTQLMQPSGAVDPWLGTRSGSKWYSPMSTGLQLGIELPSRRHRTDSSAKQIEHVPGTLAGFIQLPDSWFVSVQNYADLVNWK